MSHWCVGEIILEKPSNLLTDSSPRRAQSLSQLKCRFKWAGR